MCFVIDLFCLVAPIFTPCIKVLVQVLIELETKTCINFLWKS